MPFFFLTNTSPFFAFPPPNPTQHLPSYPSYDLSQTRMRSILDKIKYGKMGQPRRIDPQKITDLVDIFDLSKFFSSPNPSHLTCGLWWSRAGFRFLSQTMLSLYFVNLQTLCYRFYVMDLWLIIICDLLIHTF